MPFTNHILVYKIVDRIFTAITDAIEEKWNERCEERARQDVEELTRESCHPYEEAALAQEYYPTDLRGDDVIQLDVINPFEFPDPVDIPMAPPTLQVYDVDDSSPVIPALEMQDVPEKFSFVFQGTQ